MVLLRAVFGFIISACAFVTFFVLRVLINPTVKAPTVSRIAKVVQPEEPSSPTGFQRLVIHAGPHKTGTSSLQANLRAWIRSNHSGFQNLSWPSPIGDGGGQDHYPLAASLWGQKVDCTKWTKNVSCFWGRKVDCTKWTKNVSCSGVQEAFREEIQMHWKNGKSVLLATEGLDFAVHHNPDYMIQIKNLFQLLPTDVTTRNTVVVVNYRAPRVTNFISTWHQCCVKTQTFYEYVRGAPRDGLKSIDSLDLARAFLNYGVKVILVDLTGVQASGWDVSNVMACEVLGVPCRNKTVIGMSEKPVVRNVKTGMGDMGNITKTQLQKIESAIRRRDCNFLYLREESNLEIMHGFELLNVWKDCEKRNDAGIQRNRLYQEILDIITEGTPS